MYENVREQILFKRIIDAWSCLPQGRTYTLKQAVDKSYKKGDGSIGRLFKDISEFRSEDINYRTVGKFFRRTIKYSYKNLRLSSEDRGNMNKWTLIPEPAPDTEDYAEKFKVTPAMLAEAWAELPGSEDGLTKREAMKLVQLNPHKFPLMQKIMDSYKLSCRGTVFGRMLNLTADIGLLEAKDRKMMVGPRRRLRKHVKTRRKVRTYIDPANRVEKWVIVYRLPMYD